MNTQLLKIKQLGLGKTIKPKELVRKSWSIASDEWAYIAHKLGFKGLELEEVANAIGHSLSSLKLKIANIKAIESQGTGMNHFSSQLVDIVCRHK